MTTLRDIALLRLRNQRLLGPGFTTAAEVVGSLGAVQAQDYAGARWAVGQRMKRASDATIERAYDAGEILRTHVLRPTWHFVLPADIRWLSELTAPRVRALLRYYDKQLGLDERALARTGEVLRAALRGGQHLTRNQLAAKLEEAGHAATGQRLAHVLMHAELEALVCSGPRRGKQFTYALVAERAPRARRLSREQALAELTRRYFTSHGPALPQDFAWWSGLALKDVHKGLELGRAALSELQVDGRTYWHAGPVRAPQRRKPIVHLLPNYDEQLIAYRERSAAFNRERVATLGRADNVLSSHLITLDGRVIGSWKRAAKASDIEIKLLTKLSAGENQALTTARARLQAFFGG
jgi:hypothetical protein